MSINKISPALKRYKPGELSRNINTSLNLIETYQDNSIHKLTEETGQFFNPNKSLKIISGGKKNDIPNFGVESFYNNSNNNTIHTFSKENNCITSLKQHMIDEGSLDTCFENLKFAMKKIKRMVMSKELKEQISPENIFRKDSLIICTSSFADENTFEIEKRDTNNSHDPGKNGIIMNKRENENAKCEHLKSKEMIDTNQISLVEDNKNSTRSPVQDSYFNDSSREDSSYRRNKIESTSILNEKNQKITCADFIQSTQCEDLKNGLIGKESKFPLLGRKRKHQLEDPNPENTQDEIKNKEINRKNIFKTLRSEEVENNPNSSTNNKNNNNSHININIIPNNPQKGKLLNNCLNSNNSVNNNKPLLTQRTISYFDKFFLEFRKFYNSHKVDARISENKEDFLINYFRSDGIETKYHILYDQKKQRVLFLEKFFNNNLINKIVNEQNHSEVIENIQKELWEMLRDISSNVMKKV